MKIYIDTSSLVKLYHAEPGTELIDKVFEQNSITEIYLSTITKIEFNSAITKKVRTKDLSIEESIAIINAFEKDYLMYSFIETNNEIIMMAKELIIKYSAKGLRTLDAIQLACIIFIKSNISFAITADNLLSSIINEESINTL